MPYIFEEKMENVRRMYDFRHQGTIFDMRMWGGWHAYRRLRTRVNG